jgi:predicted porin
MRVKLIGTGIAGALAGAFVAPAALAQMKPVAGFEWSLYGRVYLTVEQVESKGGTTPMSSRSRVSDNSSLLGVRAEKEIGSGAKAWGQLETSFKADDTSGGTNSFANRNSGVGVSGGFGNFFFGRWDMPFKQTQTVAIDPFGDLTIAAASGTIVRQTGFNNRANNVIQYWSPSFAGLIGKLALTSNEAKSDAAAAPGTAAGADPKMHGASLEWSNGPFFIGYGYEKHKDAIGNVTPTQGTDETGNGISGKVTVNAFQVSGQYGRYERTGSDTQSSGAVNLLATFSVHQFIGSYRKSVNGGPTGSEQPKCDSWALAYKYLFDRNLDFIAEVVQVDNKVGGLCDFGQNGVGSAATAGGGDPRGIAAGLRYSF